jgi:TolB-like protein/DNA-binding winged helix-turn-helix (wHTH) protein/tetratricopeptide (TPR) repeat protein
MTEHGHFRVGDLTIDLGRGRVMRAEEEIALPKLSYDLLLFLTRAAPNLVSMDELMQGVWPRLIVSPETVSQRVKLLRDALGDDPKAPRYIAGLRGRGYQIVAPVEKLTGEQLGETPCSPTRAISSEPQLTDERAPSAATVNQVAVASAVPTPDALTRRLRTRYWLAIAAVLLIAGLLFAMHFLSAPRQEVVNAVPPKTTSQAAFSPPPRSVAVLPFVNMSGDANDEYFSDGLSEELLATLVRVDDLQVAARTSSFSFKGSSADIQTIGRRLNVAAVLEGSVRKTGERMRITAQLINTETGFHLWSETYDRDLKDVFALQSEVAVAVANAMRVRLLGDDVKQLSVGGTQNPKAFDAYLRGRKLRSATQTEESLKEQLAAYDEAISADPGFALAHSRRALVLANIGDSASDDSVRTRHFSDARQAVEQAIKLSPQSGEPYLTRASLLTLTTLDFEQIEAALRRAKTLEPGNAEILSVYAYFAVVFERADALEAADRAVALNPLEPTQYWHRGVVLYFLKRHAEARAAFREALRLGATDAPSLWAGLNELAAGNAAGAAQFCEPYGIVNCLAIAYWQLNRQEEAAAALQELIEERGDFLAYQYAQFYAQSGDTKKALDWLDRALKVRDYQLIEMKVDPLLEPLRETQRFKDIVEQLNFPD